MAAVSRIAAALLLALPAAAAEALSVATSAEQSPEPEQEAVALLQRAQERHVHVHEATHGAVQDRPMMTDVRAAFLAMNKERGQVLQASLGAVPFKGYNQGHMPYSEHFQSVQRVQGTGVFYISGSGSSEPSGQIFIMDFGSSPSPRTPGELKAVMNIDKEYWHAGGMTSFGNVLAVGCEPGCSVTERTMGRCKTAGRIHFFDTSDPLVPKRLPYVVERTGVTAGTTSLTQQDDGKWLLVVGGVDADQLDFYLSSSTSLTAGDPGFRLITSWNKQSLLVDAGSDSSYGAYQNMQFVRQADGALFLIGTYRSMNGLGSDYADLFRIDAGSHLTVTKQASIKLKCASGTCNFQAGAGVYVVSPTEMMLYGTNWEPNFKKHVIEINEFDGRS